MSRSYKKHPWITDHKVKTTKEMKKFANKSVRHCKNLPGKGSSYKKVFESYDICDYKYCWTWEDAKKDWEEEWHDWKEGKYSYTIEHFPTLKSYYRYWFTCVYGK